MDKYLHTFREIKTENGGYTVKVYPYTIDTLENLNIPVVDHVKIDIEGGEFDIIPNSKYLQNIKFIDIEFHWDTDKHDIPNEQRETYIKSNFPNHSICYLKLILAFVILKVMVFMIIIGHLDEYF